MSIFKQRYDKLDAWLENYRFHYNRRATNDEPSEEFFEKRAQWKMYRHLLKRPYDLSIKQSKSREESVA